MLLGSIYIYILKPCVIYRTIQRSENIQRPDLVICEFGDFMPFESSLEGILSYRSHALLKIKVVFR